MSPATLEAATQALAQRHALVIGGSMAGLLAARVLADDFDRVTIVERDRLTPSPEFRPGVPQSRHVHVLLRRGQMILEQLFPGWTASMTAAGAIPIDWGQDCHWYNFGGWKPQFRSGVVTLACSRQLLEWQIRQRLAQLPNVHWHLGCRVTGLTLHPPSRVSGVTLDGQENIEADLVLDASGRNSQLPHWLESLGFPAPAETRVNSFLGYASRCYQLPPNWQANWKVLIQQATPPTGKRGAILFPMEGDRWLLTLAGAGRDYPPTDEAGFLDFARSLPTPDVFEAIQQAQPLSPIYGYRRTENQRRHYENLAQWPQGLIAIGDAVCAFNPVYGQGMSVSATTAQALQHWLQLQRAQGKPLQATQSFQRQLAGVVATPWLLATGEDFRYHETKGAQPDQLTRLMHRYLDQVLLAGSSREQIHQTFLEVLHLVRSPTALFQPQVLLPVMQQAIAGWNKQLLKPGGL